MDDAEAHVWRIALEVPDATRAAQAMCLSETERARAEGFVVARDRQRFVASHVALRSILAGYVGRAPAELSFSLGPHGKPSLDDAPHVRFNLAHSGETAVVAIAAREVGVDVEQVRPFADALEIARRWFARVESAAILALPSEEQLPAFFRCWTLKEAYAKARGRGLSLPFDGFAVSLDESAPRLLHCVTDPAAPRHWKLSDLRLDPGYVGAIAVEHGFERLRDMPWSWPPAARADA